MRSITLYGSVLALTCAFGVAACDRGPNPEAQVSQALKEAKLEAVKVDWDKEAHVAHLKGTVEQATDRQRAEDVAAAAVGTSGRVLNEVTIRGMNDKTADDLDGDIRSHLKEMVNTDQVLRDRSITFDVNNGVVTVKGDVRAADEKSKVTDIVRAAPGVKDMVNALEIKPEK